MLEEPEWNVNRMLQMQLRKMGNCVRRTRVECKSQCSAQTNHSITVLEEPEWNVNKESMECIVDFECVLEEPKWNVNEEEFDDWLDMCVRSTRM